MTDYISRVEAIESVRKKVLICESLPDTIAKDASLFTLACMNDSLNSIPAADVRPVVFCRDCQNSYEWANVDGDNYRYCGYLRSRWNHDADRMVDDDGFCKWGRKREES